jgi:hypothetical protein
MKERVANRTAERETDHDRLHPIQDQLRGHLVASERRHRRRPGDDAHVAGSPTDVLDVLGATFTSRAT